MSNLQLVQKQETQSVADEVPLRLHGRQQPESCWVLVSKSQVECLTRPNYYQRLMNEK
jgi:hypothetical protein